MNDALTGLERGDSDPVAGDGGMLRNGVEELRYTAGFQVRASLREV